MNAFGIAQTGSCTDPKGPQIAGAPECRFQPFATESDHYVNHALDPECSKQTGDKSRDWDFREQSQQGQNG